MRKLAFIDIINETRKLIIYHADDEVYLFGYNCLQDTSSTWDNLFTTLDDAEEYCQDFYQISIDKWISISDPLPNCQHDFIMPTRVKNRDIGKPEYGKFETLINGNWKHFTTEEKCESLDGLSGNERLFVSGLIDEFEKAKKHDHSKARQILTALEFDEESIKRIL